MKTQLKSCLPLNKLYKYGDVHVICSFDVFTIEAFQKFLCVAAHTCTLKHAIYSASVAIVEIENAFCVST